MLGIEEVIGELNGEDAKEKHRLPPGFRFHPTDEELIAFYLASKVFKAGNSHGVKIAEVDLNRCEPWELPDEAKMGEREWYFFSLRVRKYPTGLRTNRATVAGYWKATGKDRQIYSASNGIKLGTKKTLVFYKGGAPRGVKTKWVMHEYRLHSDLAFRNACKDEWVLCRIIQKSGEKMKPRPSQTCQHEAAALSPSPISLPPLLETAPAALLEYCQSQSIDIRFQTLPNFHQRHENGLESLIMNPQFVFQSNLLPVGLQMSSFPPSSPSVTPNNFSPTLNDSHLSPSSQSSSTLLINSLPPFHHCSGEEPADFHHFNLPLHHSTAAAKLMNEIQATACGNQEATNFAIHGGNLGCSVDVAATAAYAADHGESSDSIMREGPCSQMLY